MIEKHIKSHKNNIHKHIKTFEHTKQTYKQHIKKYKTRKNLSALKTIENATRGYLAKLQRKKLEDKQMTLMLLENDKRELEEKLKVETNKRKKNSIIKGIITN